MQKFNPASDHLDVTMHASATSSNGGFLMKTSDEILRGFIPSLLTFASHSIHSKRTGFHPAPSRITGAANTSPTEPLTQPCDQSSAVPPSHTAVPWCHETQTTLQNPNAKLVSVIILPLSPQIHPSKAPCTKIGQRIHTQDCGAAPKSAPNGYPNSES